jgi:hypothetical protein
MNANDCFKASYPRVHASTQLHTDTAQHLRICTTPRQRESRHPSTMHMPQTRTHSATVVAGTPSSRGCTWAANSIQQDTIDSSPGRPSQLCCHHTITHRVTIQDSPPRLSAPGIQSHNTLSKPQCTSPLHTRSCATETMITPKQSCAHSQ